jgi:hypothetical protein
MNIFCCVLLLLPKLLLHHIFAFIFLSFVVCSEKLYFYYRTSTVIYFICLELLYCTNCSINVCDVVTMSVSTPAKLRPLVC